MWGEGPAFRGDGGLDSCLPHTSLCHVSSLYEGAPRDNGAHRLLQDSEGDHRGRKRTTGGDGGGGPVLPSFPHGRPAGQRPRPFSAFLELSASLTLELGQFCTSPGD